MTSATDTATDDTTTDDTSAAPAAPERFSPLHQAHVDAGASFTDFAGWQMPVRTAWCSARSLE
jgi:aminomethyltransferase